MVLPITDPVSLANIVAAGVEPQIRVSIPRAVLLAVAQHSLQDIRDGTVVASTIACCQNNNIAILRLSRIALPVVGMVRHRPVPLWLSLEVAWLRYVVVRCHRRRCCKRRREVPVVVDRYIAKEPEKDYQGCDC